MSVGSQPVAESRHMYSIAMTPAMKSNTQITTNSGRTKKSLRSLLAFMFLFKTTSNSSKTSYLSSQYKDCNSRGLSSYQFLLNWQSFCNKAGHMSHCFGNSLLRGLLLQSQEELEGRKTSKIPVISSFFIELANKGLIPPYSLFPGSQAHPVNNLITP